MGLFELFSLIGIVSGLSIFLLFYYFADFSLIVSASITLVTGIVVSCVIYAFDLGLLSSFGMAITMVGLLFILVAVLKVYLHKRRSIQ